MSRTSPAIERRWHRLPACGHYVGAITGWKCWKLMLVPMLHHRRPRHRRTGGTGFQPVDIMSARSQAGSLCHLVCHDISVQEKTANSIELPIFRWHCRDSTCNVYLPRYTGLDFRPHPSELTESCHEKFATKMDCPLQNRQRE